MAWIERCVSAALAASLASAAMAETVTITVTGVRSGQGQLISKLCSEAANFPSAPCTYSVKTAAKPGAVEVVFENVPAGTYALSTMHDENGNGRLDMPLEGYGFGNDQGYPPAFAAAAYKVDGPVKARVTMTYATGPGTQPVAANGPAAPAGVVKTDLREHGLYGEFYAPIGASKAPVIIAIGGSEGGVDSIARMTAPFAQQGYAVLALAYWRAPGLPQALQDVPLEYFKAAIDWAKARPEVDPKHIGLIGWSRGAEGALLIASRYPDIKAVTAIAPNGNVMLGLNFQNVRASRPAWTFEGKPVPYFIPSYAAVTPLPSATTTAGRFDADIAIAAAHPESLIPVERINGPILLLSGTDDRVWYSTTMAEQIMARLKAKHFRHAFSHQSYPGAGHAIFMGGPKDVLGLASQREFMGGSDAADAKALADSWPRTLQFFDTALKGAGGKGKTR